ncbi:MAG TPA: sigma-70 family RNA polymerase sigma factor [Candidatus Gordonibacter avicola]|nr:sigma-70 family RNA polymerase sigma factor [Candidatus Gordonibacter avicola]
MSRLVHSEFTVSVEDAIDEWGDAVLRLARRRMGNQADAEDVFQTVFLRLHQNASVINDATHLKSWLLRVTVNCCNDLHRKNNRDTSVPLEDHDAPSEPEEDLSLAEQRFAPRRGRAARGPAHGRPSALLRRVFHQRDSRHCGREPRNRSITPVQGSQGAEEGTGRSRR